MLAYNKKKTIYKKKQLSYERRQDTKQELPKQYPSLTLPLNASLRVSALLEDVQLQVLASQNGGKVSEKGSYYQDWPPT